MIAVIAILCCTGVAHAQAGSAARAAARELVETVLRTGGRQATEELAEIGGEAAVREVLEKAMREGGEALAGRVTHYGRATGFAALKVIERSPSRWVRVLDELGAEMAGPALRAARREPELLTRLMTTYGKEAVEVAVKHPGVGTRLIETLGKDGVEMGMKLGTDDAIRLARHGEDIAKLAPTPRSRVLDKIARSPRAVLGFLEANPKVLLTAAGVATVLAVKDEFLGEAGERRVLPDGTVVEPAAGFAERMADRIIDRFHEPLSLVLGIVGLIVLGWGAIQLWHVWRMKQLRQAIAGARARPDLR